MVSPEVLEMPISSSWLPHTAVTVISLSGMMVGGGSSTTLVMDVPVLSMSVLTVQPRKVQFGTVPGGRLRGVPDCWLPLEVCPLGRGSFAGKLAMVSCLGAGGAKSAYMVTS